MSNNDFLDTYIGRVYLNGECVELMAIRAVDFVHAGQILREQYWESPVDDTSVPEFDVKRWRHSRCVATPSDIVRNKRRKRKSKAPQYGV